MQGKNYLIEFKNDILDIGKNIYANNETKKAFVRGVFLGSGSITEPDKRYHLEMKLKEEKRKR